MKGRTSSRTLGRWVGMAAIAALTGLAVVDDVTAKAPPPATFTVTTSNPLEPDTLHFITGLGVNPPSQRLTLKNGPGNLLNWTTTVTTTDGGNWLSVKPKKGRTQKNRSRKLNVAINVIGPPALPASGNLYTGTIVFKEKGNLSNAVTIHITLRVTDKAAPVFYTTDPTGALIPTSKLDFDAANDGMTGFDPPPQTLTLRNDGSKDMNTTLAVSTDDGFPWLKVTPAITFPAVIVPTGQVDMTVGTDVAGQVANLPPGIYHGTITASDPNALPTMAVVDVYLTVHDSPFIEVSPSPIVFDEPVGGCPSGAHQGVITIHDGGTGPLTWSASIDTVTYPWLAFAAGTTTSDTMGAQQSQTFTIEVDAAAIVGTPPAFNQGFVTINSNDPTRPSIQVEVDLNVNDIPTVQLEPNSVTLHVPQGSATVVHQNITLANVGIPTLKWTSLSDSPWLTVTPSSDTSTGLGACEETTLTLNIDPTLLTDATNIGTIEVDDSPNADPSDFVTVTVIVDANPVAHVDPDTLTFTAVLGGADPGSQNVTLTNPGVGDLNWTLLSSDTSWLTVSSLASPPLAAGAPGVTLTVAVTQASLSTVGTVNGTITVSGSGATSAVINVSFTLTSATSIELSPTILNFGGLQNGVDPAAQGVTVKNTGIATFTWNATPNDAWLTVTKPGSRDLAGGASGGANGTFSVQPLLAGLAPGIYHGTVTVSAPGNTDVILSVTLIVSSVPGAGYCGSTGLDLLLPLGFLWAFRRFRNRGRISSPALAVLILGLFGASSVASAEDDFDLPRTLQDEEKPVRPTGPLPQNQQDPNTQVPDALDFGKLTLAPHAGFLSFSTTFKDTIEFVGGVTLRVPSPLISSSFGTDPGLVDFFVDLSVGTIARKVPFATGTSGALLFASGGTEFALIREGSFELQPQVGFQYGYFGGVSGLSNGFALLVGIRSALKLGEGVWLAVNPQMTFANGGNRILFVNVGLDIGF